MGKTEIEWATDVWNPVTGCTKVSPGCKFCYAERVATRYWGARKFTDVRLHPDRLDAPLHWRRPRRIFVNSMSDLFHEAVPDEFLDRIFTVMALAPRHTFQVLSKRAERMHAYLVSSDTPGRVAHAILRGDQWSTKPGGDWPLRNCWMGVSVEDQARADERIPWLLKTPAAVRFLSVEPLLGPVDLNRFLRPGGRDGAAERPGVDWVIVGGESGGPPDRSLVAHSQELATPGGRDGWWPKPEAETWVRSLRDQCVKAGVPWFLKQWGGPTPKAGGRMLDGRRWSEYPPP